MKQAKYNDKNAVKERKLKDQFHDELKITNNPVSQALMNDDIDKLVSLV